MIQNFTATYTDQYQLAMAEVYFLKNRHNTQAVFDYFFRKAPFNGSYVLFTGLANVLDILENFHFSSADIDFLHKQKFNGDFLNYLENYRFKGNIYSVREGEVVFATEPLLTVEAGILDAQLVETFLLNMLNFQSLIATKASRMRKVAGQKKLIDFGLRRAQGTGSYFGARAAIVGGFDATSNVVAGRDFNIPVSGTMAHSFIQSYDDELTAFRHFAEQRPHDTVLLVDTYNTLESGLPNAIKVGKEMEAKGLRLNGIRLDSGDLAYLSQKARKMLDDAGLDYVKIAASNQLDECLIKSLNQQNAAIDLYGVGTSLMTGQPDSALDGVFKLAEFNESPRIKLSESSKKITLPGKKQVYRMFDEQGMFAGADVVCFRDEDNPKMMHHPFEHLKKMEIEKYGKEPLIKPVMENGKQIEEGMDIHNIAAFANKRLAMLPDAYRRFENPHIYKIGLSENFNRTRNQLIENYSNKNQ